VACLLGTLFVVGDLSRTREYIAGLAGGLPPEKFLSGLFWAGLSISVMALIANETFIPKTTAYSRTVFRQKIRHLGDWQETVFKNLVVAGTEGRLWTIQVLDENTGKINRVIIDTYSDGKLGNQVDARVASWG
jgi:lipopolysaccharide export LptBFGC system permease protein LptF